MKYIYLMILMRVDELTILSLSPIYLYVVAPLPRERAWFVSSNNVNVGRISFLRIVRINTNDLIDLTIFATYLSIFHLNVIKLQ